MSKMFPRVRPLSIAPIWLRRAFSLTVLCAVGIPAPSAVAGVPCVPAPGVNDVCERWSAPLALPGERADYATHLAVDYRARRAYVAGTTLTGDGQMMTTAAYDTSTGSLLWRNHDSANPPTLAISNAVSPDGKLVFSLGVMLDKPDANSATESRPLVVAYSSRTGRVAWRSIYAGVGTYISNPVSLAVGPDAHTVFMTGYERATGVYSGVPPTEFFTIAYSAVTGRELWTSRYFGLGGGTNNPTAVAVAPGRVYVTGFSEFPTRKLGVYSDWATVAYSARDGHRLWLRRFGTLTRNSATAAAYDPHNRTLVVTGLVQESGSNSASSEWDTIAYSANDGRTAWTARYNTSGSNSNPTAVVVGGDGTAYVAGTSSRRATAADSAGATTQSVATVLAYTSQGKLSWAASPALPAGFQAVASALAISHSGNQVYLAAEEAPLLSPAILATPGECTVLAAFDPQHGQQRWVARSLLRDTDSFVDAHAATGVASAPSGVLALATSIPLPTGVDQPPVTTHPHGTLFSYSESR